MNSNKSIQELDMELDRMYSAITERAPFRYDAASDPMFRQYRDSYIQRGRSAMRDTMAQAAALTGGYGSSYAQSVGQQSYDKYLRALSELMPELYSAAYKSYQAQGQGMRDDYALLYQQVSDEKARAAAEEARQYERDKDAQEAAAAAEAQDYKRKNDAYSRLRDLVSGSGYVPEDGELEQSGMTRAQADALRYEYQRKNDLLPKPAAAVSYGTTKSTTVKKVKPKDYSKLVNNTSSSARSGSGSGTSSITASAIKSGKFTTTLGR